MLKVYFDESYNHRTAKEPNAPLVYTVAGYLADDELWSAFEQEWSQALMSVGLPFFHMADYESRLNHYEQWPNEQRVEFLQTLHAIINRHVLKGISTSVLLSDYESLTDEQRYAFGEPHIYALVNCMKTIARLCDEFDHHEPIDYFFENGVFDGRVREFFSTFRRDEIIGYRLGSIDFPSKDCMPLQAADILAYEMTKEMVRSHHANNKRPIRKSIRNLAVQGIDEWFYVEREHFIQSLTIAKELGLYDGEI